MTITIDPKHPLGSGALLWLLSGRIPGDDDDTPMLFLADTEEDAKAAYVKYMHELADLDADGLKQLEADHGKTCYINVCDQIGAEQSEPREYAIAMHGLPGPTWLQQQEDDNDLVLPLTSNPVLAATYTEAEARSLWADVSKRFPSASFRLDRLATPARVAELEQRLHDIAAGARSKADLIASKSPTSIYFNAVDVLRALAKEAEAGLGPDQDKGLEIQRTLMLSTAHLPVSHREWLDAENRCNQFCLWKVLPTALNQEEEAEDATLIVDPISDYGWRICVTEAVEGFAAKVTSDDPLLNLLRFAEAHNCDWLAIDRDGDVVDGLPTFED